MPIRTIYLDFPPSVNERWLGCGKNTHITKSTAAFELSSAYRIMSLRGQKKLPRAKITGPIALIIYLRPPDNHRRDIDNYIKAINDALTKGNVWDDDSQVKSFLPQWLKPDPSKKRGETIVTIIYGSEYNKIINEFDCIAAKYGAKSC
ncbi:MAG: RusA family crossover junction endodeoxyribonuclease [Desulfovibrionaceae bacterium]|nr:RusA family crossover junction endodeoxyribonuclease [Desulfovibrionaceae bacterium]